MVDFVIGARFVFRNEKGGQIARLHGVEEKWPIVADRGNVVAVLLVERFGIGSGEKAAEFIRGRVAGEVDGLKIRGGEFGAKAIQLDGLKRTAGNENGVLRAPAAEFV